MSAVHINRPRVESFCAVNDCPTCERPRRMLGRHAEWYGTTWICAGCGDRWSDGERLYRPLVPGWRRRSIEYARAELSLIGVPA